MLHDIVNKEMKKFNLVPIFPYKSLWEFNRKTSIIGKWLSKPQMTKKDTFLDLFDNDLNFIELTYSKEES